MLVDALIVFVLVVVWLTISIAILWLVAKLLGYIAALFEGEKLVPTLKSDFAVTRRQFRRHQAIPGH